MFQFLKRHIIKAISSLRRGGRHCHFGVVFQVGGESEQAFFAFFTTPPKGHGEHGRSALDVYKIIGGVMIINKLMKTFARILLIPAIVSCFSPGLPFLPGSYPDAAPHWSAAPIHPWTPRSSACSTTWLRQHMCTVRPFIPARRHLFDFIGMFGRKII